MTTKNFDTTNDLIVDACSMTKKRWESNESPIKSKIVDYQ